jgi:hypothetical protein
MVLVFFHMAFCTPYQVNNRHRKQSFHNKQFLHHIRIYNTEFLLTGKESNIQAADSPGLQLRQLTADSVAATLTGGTEVARGLITVLSGRSNS